MIMVPSVLKFFTRKLKTAFLSCALLSAGFSQAQTGGAISGYKYLGTTMVSGQPHYYYVSTSPKTWPDAKTAATGLGGYLATLTSLPENDFVFGQLKNYLIYGTNFNPTGAMLGAPNGPGLVPLSGLPCDDGIHHECSAWGDTRHTWIGLSDAETEGTFVWANGESSCSDFRHFDEGEPNNFGFDEDYVELLAFDKDPSLGGNQKQGYWNDWFNETSLTYIVEFGASSCNPVQRGTQGCTHGYWKNAKDKAWTDAGYSRNDLFMTKFGIGVSNGRGVVDATTTLQQALELQAGGYNQVAKQGTAALLNASRGFYPYSAGEIIAAVGSMFNSGTATLLSVTVNGTTYAGGTWKNDPVGFAAYLDNLNKLGCPLNNAGLMSSSTTRLQPNGLTLDKEFSASGYPNPSRTSFNIQIEGATSESMTIKVTDMTGRLIEHRTNVPANQTLQIGSNYKAGMYYVEVLQGSNKQNLKLVKQ